MNLRSSGRVDNHTQNTTQHTQHTTTSVAILAQVFDSTDLIVDQGGIGSVLSGTSTFFLSCCAQVFGVQEVMMSISLRERMRWSPVDAREAVPVLMSEELVAAPLDAMLAAVVFVLAV